MKIILASNSPRRRELLAQIGLKYEVMPSNFEENEQNMPPEDLVKYFSYMKAKDVYERLVKGGLRELSEDTLIIGADTVVFFDTIMGKPKNEQDAFSMLKKLSNQTHDVISGVSVFQLSSGKSLTDFEKTSVRFKALEDNIINNYIKSGEPADKAGAYAIQGIGSIFVKGIEGDYFNVVGLPLFKLSEMMLNFGVSIL